MRRNNNRKNTRGRYTQHIKCKDGSTKCIKHSPKPPVHPMVARILNGKSENDLYEHSAE